MNATISTFTSNLFYFLHVLHVPKFFQLYHLLPSGRSNGWKQSCMQMIPWHRLKGAGFFQTDESGVCGDSLLCEERGRGVRGNQHIGECHLHAVCILLVVVKARRKRQTGASITTCSDLICKCECSNTHGMYEVIVKRPKCFKDLHAAWLQSIAEPF